MDCLAKNINYNIFTKAENNLFFLFYYSVLSLFTKYSNKEMSFIISVILMKAKLNFL